MTPRVRGPNVIVTHSYIWIRSVSWPLDWNMLNWGMLSWSCLAASDHQWSSWGVPQSVRMSGQLWEHLQLQEAGSSWCWSLPEAYSKSYAGSAPVSAPSCTLPAASRGVHWGSAYTPPRTPVLPGPVSLHHHGPQKHPDRGFVHGLFLQPVHLAELGGIFGLSYPSPSATWQLHFGAGTPLRRVPTLGTAGGAPAQVISS